MHSAGLLTLLLAPAAAPAPCPEPDSFSAPGARRATERVRVEWADPARVHEPSPRISLTWAAWQLVPSPELGVSRAGARFGLKWQLTPALYSFGTDPRLSRWRWFVAEPIVRHSGSIELFVSPEYLSGSAAGAGVRFGMRSYFGVIERGDYLSVSLGTSYYRFGEHDGASYEAGAYVLFGVLGVELGYLPHLEALIATLRLRYF